MPFLLFSSVAVLHDSDTYNLYPFSNVQRASYICCMFDTDPWCRHQNAGRFALIAAFLLLILLMQHSVLRAQHNSRTNYQLLWRIDGPGLLSPSYLFGTMHLTDKRVFEFSDSVLTALQGTTDFAMEVDIDSLMGYMFSPGGPLLDTVNYMRQALSPEEYRYVDSLVIEKTGGPLQQLSVKRLWFLEKLLIDQEEALDKNTDFARKKENIFLDGWLHQKATRLNKQVRSLEKLENQMDIMGAGISEVQKEAFLWSLGYKNTGVGDPKDRTDRLMASAASLDTLVNLYYKGDLQKIAEVVNDWENIGNDLRLVSRNIEMADNLALLISKRSVFAAVGVAHLPGEKGIIALLRKKGYSVNPVNATFTGVTERERQRLDSMKGYSLNRIVDGYSVELPGAPLAYPLPNINRKMYVGANDIEAGFAFAMDIPQLATDKRQLENALVANMAAQGKAVLQRSYPINYRNISGIEAVMQQQSTPFYVRVFIRNNRAFVFMYSFQGTDSSAMKDFFQSVRFYDIVRPAIVYDTLYRPELGFSVILPSEHSHAHIGNKEGVRPEEVYSALDNANNISYVIQVEKMQRGYYNTNDKQLLDGLRVLMSRQDSSLQLIDSAVTEKNGLQRYQFSYRHGNGFISRLHFIPRGNLAYCLFCTYDPASTDSSYWQHFLNAFQVLPLQSLPPAVRFMPADSSFTVTGPGAFEGGLTGDGTRLSNMNTYSYVAMDSSSNSMYLVEVDKYSHYFHKDPDSLLESFIHTVDTTFVVTGKQQYVAGGLPVYEVEMKVRNAGLRFYRKAVIAGHTIYRLSAILPEELAPSGYAQQFLASFRPGRREKADTFRLQKKKLDILLKDLQSRDTVLFYKAIAYLPLLYPDSLDTGLILDGLKTPFPLDTGDIRAKTRLLLKLQHEAGDAVVYTAGMLFDSTRDIRQRKQILRYLNRLKSDTAVRTFLRLAPELPEGSTAGGGIFVTSLLEDSLYRAYLPVIVTTAERSRSFLEAFVTHTSRDSIWLPPYFSQYKLESLLPGVVQLFKQQLQAWKNRSPDADESWMWEQNLLSTGGILALPGMPAAVTAGFQELLADSTLSLRALGAEGLMNRGIKVNDKILRSILADRNESYRFIETVKNNKQLPAIRHLLTQELLGRSYLTYYLSEEYDVTAIEQVTRVKVQEGKRPAVWLILYRYKTGESEDWEYVLNGTHPMDPAVLNYTPQLMHWVNEKSIVTDKTKLGAEASKAYKKYLEEE